MVMVDKCCLCLRLSTGAIILGSFGAFTSLLLVMLIGVFVLSYDNYVAQAYENPGSNNDNNRLADFLSTYKNGEEVNARTQALLQNSFNLHSYPDDIGNLFRSPRHQFREFALPFVWSHQRKDENIDEQFGR